MATKNRPNLPPIQMAILRFIGEVAWCLLPWAAVQSHLRLTGWPRANPTRSLNALVRRGLIEQSHSSGDYQLSDAGWQFLKGDPDAR